MTYHFDYLDEDTNQYINQAINSNEELFDIKRFELWADVKNIKGKDNPNAYIRKIFKTELLNGTFKKAPKKKIVVNTIPLFRAMDKLNMLVPESEFMIDVALNYIINNEILTYQELIELDNRLVKYMFDYKLKSDEYVSLLMKSNTLKGKLIDWNEIILEGQRLEKKWNELVKTCEMPEEKPMSVEEYIEHIKKEGDTNECG